MTTSNQSFTQLNMSTVADYLSSSIPQCNDAFCISLKGNIAESDLNSLAAKDVDRKFVIFVVDLLTTLAIAALNSEDLSSVISRWGMEVRAIILFKKLFFCRSKIVTVECHNVDGDEVINELVKFTGCNWEKGVRDGPEKPLPVVAKAWARQKSLLLEDDLALDAELQSLSFCEIKGTGDGTDNSEQILFGALKEYMSVDSRLSKINENLMSGDKLYHADVTVEGDCERLMILNEVAELQIQQLRQEIKLIATGSEISGRSSSESGIEGKRTRSRSSVFRQLKRRLYSPKTKQSLRLLRSSDLFDESWYLRVYPDVKASSMFAHEHYFFCGAAEGRDPSLAFSTSKYLSQNPLIKGKNINPLIHFLRSR